MSCRAGVLMSARVHPGESNSSWMMQGLIDWLTSDAPHAKVYIPMLSLVIKCKCTVILLGTAESLCIQTDSHAES